MAEFKCRFSDDAEYEAWQRAAAALGMTTSAYVKARVRGVPAVPAPNYTPPAKPKRR